MHWCSDTHSFQFTNRNTTTRGKEDFGGHVLRSVQSFLRKNRKKKRKKKEKNKKNEKVHVATTDLGMAHGEVDEEFSLLWERVQGVND